MQMMPPVKHQDGSSNHTTWNGNTSKAGNANIASNKVTQTLLSQQLLGVFNGSLFKQYFILAGDSKRSCCCLFTCANAQSQP